ncbi:LamG-like jellyroll fold domain-containing protein [Clostridium sp.]|uniref:LamG-like jellyroll fold domain-containing protein n=1 Tax=Clostridium sp. TaxID=1506 RepID=UPI00321774EF
MAIVNWKTDKLINTTGYKPYGAPKTGETFLINGNSTGDLGSRPIGLGATPVKDSKGYYTFKVQDGGGIPYNLGLSKNKGTMAMKFKTYSSGSPRYLLCSLSPNSGSLAVYITTGNKLCLAFKDSNKNWLDVLEYDTPIATGQWNMLTISWAKNSPSTTFNMYVNGNKKSKSLGISNYTDFSGPNIMIGEYSSGHSLEGNLDELILSSKCYDDNTVKSMYTKGRGKAVDKVGQNNYAYNNDRLLKVSSNSASYNFAYDGNGNQKSVAVGNATLITNDYDNVSGLLKNATYGNGNTVAYSYDDLNRVTSKTLDGKISSKYTYDNLGNLAISQDLKSGITNKYTYDLADRLVKTEDSNGNWFKYDYDKTNKTSKKENYIAGKSYSTSFEFDKDGKTENVSLPSGKTFFYIYDSIGRTKSRTLNLNSAYTYDTEYKYKDGYAGSTTTMVSSIKNGNSEIKYTYDDLGRIETIDNGKVIKYYYDSLGQVVREDNGELNQTIVYTYDQSGNILKVTEYPLAITPQLGAATKTVDYSYGDSNWKD